MNGIGEREIGRMKKPPFLESYSTLAGFNQFFGSILPERARSQRGLGCEISR